MTPTRILACVALALGAIGSAVVLVGAWQDLAGRAGLVRVNYRGARVVTGAGIALLVPLCMVILTLAILGTTTLQRAVSSVAGLCLLTVGGVVDDAMVVLGAEEPKGWTGHLGLFIRTRRTSAGMWKVLFGFAAGLVTAAGFWGGGVLEVLIALLLVPLGANTMNLLDLRPGRAAKATVLLLVSGVVSAWIGSHSGAMTLTLTGLLAGTVLASYARSDMAELVMLGDSGSNLLGGFTAYFIIFASPVGFRFSVLLLFVLVQIASERASMSVVIQKVPLLRRVDLLGQRAVDANGRVTTINREEEEEGRRI